MPSGYVKTEWVLLGHFPQTKGNGWCWRIANIGEAPFACVTCWQGTAWIPRTGLYQKQFDVRALTSDRISCASLSLLSLDLRHEGHWFLHRTNDIFAWSINGCLCYSGSLGRLNYPDAFRSPKFRQNVEVPYSSGDIILGPSVYPTSSIHSTLVHSNSWRPLSQSRPGCIVQKPVSMPQSESVLQCITEWVR